MVIFVRADRETLTRDDPFACVEVYPVLVRRLLWISSVGLILFLLAAGVIYLANPFSVRTWVLAKALRSGIGSVREAAAEALVARDPEVATEVFVDAHGNSDSGPYEERYWRFRLLPPEMAEKLANMLEDPDPARAAAAAAGIEALICQYEDREFSAVLPALLRALERKDPLLCLLAASTICRIDPESRDLTKVLLRASREGCPVVVIAISETRQLSDEDVGELIDSLGREDAQLRKQVAYALGRLEAHRDRSVPALVALLRDESGLVIHAALSSLQRLEHRDPATMREVTALLGREAVRMYAVEFLAGSTSSSPEALAVVKAALRNSPEATEFLDALGNAAPETLSPELIPDLLDLCRAGADLDQRMSAVELLGGMGPAAKSSVPAIEEILAKNEDEDFVQAARTAVENIEAEN